MKVKHIYSAALLALLAAGCTNDDFTGVNSGALKGEMMDATNFTLVNVPNEGADTRVAYVPGYFDGGNEMQFVTPTWEESDEIGFSHIYETDQRLVTNYKFTIKKEDAGKSTGAEFTTDNSTIFEGEYFVYYPFNEKYADYNGIPFELSNIQTQDASEDARVTRAMKPVEKVNGVETHTADWDKFVKAGAHLQANKFSISNRVKADAQVQQTAFSFNQYTSQICYLIYPKNQSKAIYIKRIELVPTEGNTLEVPTAVRFNAVAGDDAPVPETEKTADKAVLLFENVNGSTGAGGLKVEANTTEKTAVMAYISMIPTTYAQDTYKFVVYYTEDADTESNSLKKVEIDKKGVTMTLISNKVQPVLLPVDANGATEVTTGYDIYTETEFASAVVKSNNVTSGSCTFNLANDIELNNDYTLSSSVPVTFKGEKTVTVASGKTLTFNSPNTVTFQNTIKGEGKVAVSKGTVEIASINDEKLELTNAGTLTVKNEDGQGDVLYASNSGNLTLWNANVASNVGVHNENGTVDLKDVVVNGSVTFNNEVKAKSAFENVTVKGDLTNNAATLEVLGSNVLAYNEGATTMSTLTNKGTINFLEGATATIGNLTSAAGAAAKINLGTLETPATVQVTVKGKAALGNSLVYVSEPATFTAEGKLEGLKSDGTENANNTTMILEGKLETAGEVTGNGNFAFCGKVVNRQGGVWTIGANPKLSRFIHTHNTTATFVNEKGGIVYVNGVTDANAEDAMNALPKDLYNAESEGTLVWRGISSIANLDAIYKLGEDCWATDLEASLNTDDAKTASETLSDGADWSGKNIVLNIIGNDKGKYTLAVGAEKQVKAANLTIIGQNKENKKSRYDFVVTGGDAEGALAVTNTFELINQSTDAFYIDIQNGATCNNLTVNNKKENVKFYIQNGTKIHYTGTYTQLGDTENTVYPNGTPQVK